MLWDWPAKIFPTLGLGGLSAPPPPRSALGDGGTWKRRSLGHVNRRSLASWPAERNIPLARWSPCSATPDTTPSTADATLVPTQTHPTWITGKNPLQLLICWSVALHSQDLFPICILLQGFSSFPKQLQQQLPTVLCSNPGLPPVLQLPEGFSARLSGQNHLCQLLVGSKERREPASIPPALLPPPCPAPVGRGAAPPVLLPWKQRSALGCVPELEGEMLPAQRARAEPESWNDLQEHVMEKGIAVTETGCLR